MLAETQVVFFCSSGKYKHVSLVCNDNKTDNDVDVNIAITYCGHGKQKKL